jgi:transcriptional regulator with AAA-type ATPase domain
MIMTTMHDGMIAAPIIETGEAAPGMRHGIIGGSTALRRVLAMVESVAGTDAAILIRGETGTGKELIAGLIHKLSAYKRGPLVKFNCTATPAGLLESELFGHERGAFTTAIARRIGRFELANKGTLMLDEIGDLPLELQPKLLRVLEEQEFERIGSTQTMRTDVRIIAATNRPLEELVEAGQFRADLYYRLNVFPIDLPPLRERVDDIPLLVRHFVAHHAARIGRRIDTIPPEVIEQLVRHPWPGNVRELQHVVHRALILSRGGVLEIPPLDAPVKTTRTPAANVARFDDAVREHILEVLRESNGVVAGPRGAAVRLGLKRSTLLSKMDKLGSAPADVAQLRNAFPSQRMRASGNNTSRRRNDGVAFSGPWSSGARASFDVPQRLRRVAGSALADRTVSAAASRSANARVALASRLHPRYDRSAIEAGTRREANAQASHRRAAHRGSARHHRRRRLRQEHEAGRHDRAQRGLGRRGRRVQLERGIAHVSREALRHQHQGLRSRRCRRHPHARHGEGLPSEEAERLRRHVHGRRRERHGRGRRRRADDEEPERRQGRRQVDHARRESLPRRQRRGDEARALSDGGIECNARPSGSSYWRERRCSRRVRSRSPPPTTSPATR